MTETNQERRRRQANAVHIRASLQRMPLAEFEQHFKKPWFLANPTFRDLVEGNTQELFCDECMCEGVDGGIVAYIFHVSIEDDPLKNFWKLATMRCFGCGFSEIVPLEQPAFDAADFNSIGAMRPANIAPGQIMSTGIAPHDIWMQEYANQHSAYAQQQEAAKQRAMAQAKLQLAQQEYEIKRLDRASEKMSHEQKPPSIGIADSQMVEYLRKKLGL